MRKIWILYEKGKLMKNELYQLYACEASQLGAEAIFFQNNSIDLEKKTVEGYVYDEGRWRKQKCPFPDHAVIVKDSQMEQASSTLSEMILPLPEEWDLLSDRWSIYERLQKGEFYQDFIPCEKIKSSGHFFRVMKDYRKLVMKSSIGLNEYLIEQIGNDYVVSSQGNCIEMNRSQLRQFVINLQKQQQHVIQPHLLWRTKEGEVFNVAVSLEKDECSEWRIGKIVPRFYLRHHPYLQNEEMAAFWKGNFPNHAIEANCKLQSYCFRFLERLDDKYKNVSELSIFLKMDDMDKIWVDEIQWKVDRVEMVRERLKKALLMSKHEEGNHH